MKSGYILAGMPLGQLIPLLWRQGVRARPAALLRALFALQAGFWASFLARIEAWRFGRPAAGQAPDDPLIIVGHWRTGTTFLHQLMARDPALIAPNLLQCTWPASPRAAARYLTRPMGPLVRGHRPMDNVRLALDEPQEDEWATFRLTALSPLVHLVFPSSSRYFFLDALDRSPRPVAPAWVEALRRFAAAVVGTTGRRLVLKNPFHSLRIVQLAEAFPRSRFILITRDPRVVVPSARHMWTVVGQQNAMHPWAPPSDEEVVEGLARLTARVERDLGALPADRWAQLRYEDLVADPLGALDRLYAALGMSLSEAGRAALQVWLGTVRGYARNRYAADPARDALVVARMRGHMEAQGYLDS